MTRYERGVRHTALRAGGVEVVADALAVLLSRPVLVADPGGPEATAWITAPVLLGHELVARLRVPARLTELSGRTRGHDVTASSPMHAHGPT